MVRSWYSVHLSRDDNVEYNVSQITWGLAEWKGWNKQYA